MMWLQSVMHSLQIHTPGPATTFATCRYDFPQNEHVTSGSPVTLRA